MPARSVTLTCSVLLAVRVWLDRLQVFTPTVVAAAVQLMPLSNETYTVSPVATVALSVPLTVCAAVWVIKSLSVPVLPAVSALKIAVAIEVVGALPSTAAKLPS